MSAITILLACAYFEPKSTEQERIHPVRQSIVTRFAHSCVLPLRPTGMFFTSPGVPFNISSLGIIPVPVIMAGATSLKVMPLLPSTATSAIEDPIQRHDRERPPSNIHTFSPIAASWIRLDIDHRSLLTHLTREVLCHALHTSF